MWSSRMRGSLRAKLLLADLLIIIVGVSTMLLAITALAPSICDQLVQSMMSSTAP